MWYTKLMMYRILIKYEIHLKTIATKWNYDWNKYLFVDDEYEIKILYLRLSLYQ